MSILLKRGTSAAIDTSTTILLPGLPLISTDTGELTIATENLIPLYGKTFIPTSLLKLPSYDLSVLVDLSASSVTYSGITFYNTVDVYCSDVSSTTISKTMPDWLVSKGYSTTALAVILYVDEACTSRVKRYINPSAFNSSMYPSFKYTFAISSKSYAVTYFLPYQNNASSLTTYYNKIPDSGGWYLIMGLGSATINTTSSVTPTYNSGYILGVEPEFYYKDRTPGNVYFDGKKFIIKP